MKVSKKEIAPLLRGTFPDYKGKRFFVDPSGKVTLYDLNWCEGTRYQYRAVSLDGTPLGGADKYNATAPWHNQAEGKTIEIPRGACIAAHGYNAGRESGVTFYINHLDMPALLQHAGAPAEQKALS